MLRSLSPISIIFVAFVLILQFFTFVKAQDLDVKIRISADSPYRADVRGSFRSNDGQKPPRNLWFMDEYAGISGLLAERFSKIGLYDKQGYLIANKRFRTSDSFTDVNVGGFGYSVDLTPRLSAFAAAHVSWFNGEGGLIMLDDLLPQGVGKTALVSFDVPAGWKIIHAESGTLPNEFTVSNIEKAVIYFGPKTREHSLTAGKSNSKLSISSEWLFTDAEAVEMAGSIFREYENAFGSLPNLPTQIWIAKFPHPTGIGNWEADTRGRSVTIVSSDMPFRTQSLQRLHEQLRHELFHLWIPNGVNLIGNYDWFYEGFALYQSLKTGVAVNRLRFGDFLDTLARAYDIDSMQSTRISLVEASKNRWKGSNTQVYARGMLVAFLCDLALLDSSKGKVSVQKLIRDVYDKHRASSESIDGNSAIIAIMGIRPELNSIVTKYINAAEPFDWSTRLTKAGIDVEVKDLQTRLKVTAKPSGKQKDLLDKLGYNNWRKMSKSNR